MPKIGHVFFTVENLGHRMGIIFMSLKCRYICEHRYTYWLDTLQQIKFLWWSVIRHASIILVMCKRYGGIRNESPVQLIYSCLSNKKMNQISRFTVFLQFLHHPNWKSIQRRERFLQFWFLFIKFNYISSDSSVKSLCTINWLYCNLKHNKSLTFTIS